VPIAYTNFAINTDFRAPNKLLGTVGQLQRALCPDGNGTVIDTLTFGLCGGGPEGMVDPFKRAANIDFDMHASFDPTFNVGILWEPKKWFALGAVYQGGSDTTFRGQYMVHADPMLRGFVRGLNSSLLGPIVGAVTGMPTGYPRVPERQHDGQDSLPLAGAGRDQADGDRLRAAERRRQLRRLEQVEPADLRVRPERQAARDGAPVRLLELAPGDLQDGLQERGQLQLRHPDQL
jgi:hypothetical protein